MTVWVQDDGGRAAAGFKGHTGDCVTRSIAIATGLPYRTVYDDLHNAMLSNRKLMNKWTLQYGPEAARRRASPRTGVHNPTTRAYMKELGWQWTPTMHIGQGCQVHLKADELPAGRLVVRCSRHITCVIDGVIHDTHDPSRFGTRCVYGYWSHTELSHRIAEVT